MKQITIVLDEKQIKKIDEIASHFSQSRNFIIREAINIYINRFLQSFQEKNKYEPTVD